MSKKLLLFFLAVFLVLPLCAQREMRLINDNWMFRFSHQVAATNAGLHVELPHTWNALDALSGKIDYKRGIGNYSRILYVPSQWQGQRLFLRFEGVYQVANVFLNGHHLSEHRGGYGAFVVEITNHVLYGAQNRLLVRVNNGEQLDIMPIVGDFNFYGGIYRNVSLLRTPQLCISPLDYASCGVYLVQEEVTEKRAKVNARVVLSGLETVPSGQVKVEVRILEGERVVAKASNATVIEDQGRQMIQVPLTLARPHLWNGKEDPYLYQVEVALLWNGEEIDSVTQSLGLRSFSVDPNKGFILNGRPLALRGVNRHQDRSEIGSALRPQHHQEDAQLLNEMGVNAVRLAHYPQATYFYDLMDQSGIVVWAEIPFIGPGGYQDRGFVDQPSFKENGKQQLIELIRQHYNHPSICFWGLFNELKTETDSPVEYIKELNALTHKEDPTRLTTGASNIDDENELHDITQLIAWNKYYGWYGGNPSDIGNWLDYAHKNYPQRCIAVSEYGAGASIYHQQDTLLKPNAGARFHPENWQTYYHMENWKAISQRPFVWGSFVWNMFDFGAAHRTEGDRPGINDKGLVTFDRRVRKDAFYFYKANWNKEEPTVHLTGKRNTQRTRAQQDFMVFTTFPEAELFVNGVSQGVKPADDYATVTWNAVALRKGANVIEVRSGSLRDGVTLYY